LLQQLTNLVLREDERSVEKSLTPKHITRGNFMLSILSLRVLSEDRYRLKAAAALRGGGSQRSPIQRRLRTYVDLSAFSSKARVTAQESLGDPQLEARCASNRQIAIDGLR
jgi:hypothetical protein